MNNQKEHRKAIVGLVIFTALLMLTGGVMMEINGSQTTPRASPAVAITNNSIIPDPTLNTNVTWNTFYSGWNPLEYNNGTGNQTLNTGKSTYYQNPIEVNPAFINSAELIKDVGNQGWLNTSNWHTAGGDNGGVITKEGNTITTSMGSNDLQKENNKEYMNISTAYIPSTNPSYDYLTAIIGLSSNSAGTGQTINLGITNTSKIVNDGCAGPHISITNNTAQASGQLGQGIYMFTMPASAWVKNFDNGNLYIYFNTNLPTTTTNDSITQTVTIYGLALTTTPLTIGSFSNATGTHSATGITQTTRLNSFSPDFPYTSVTNDSYTVAVSQTLQNITVSKASIDNGIYAEQVTYQGIETLPTAPDLTYGAANITMPMEINGKQYEVANVNGVSFLSEIQTKTNGTFAFGSVNPNSQNTIILEVQYTSSQWNKVSGAPGFFSDPIGAIEYYWYIALGIVLGVVGLGAGFKSKSAGFRVGKK